MTRQGCRLEPASGLKSDFAMIRRVEQADIRTRSIVDGAYCGHGLPLPFALIWLKIAGFCQANIPASNDAAQGLAPCCKLPIQ